MFFSVSFCIFFNGCFTCHGLLVSSLLLYWSNYKNLAPFTSLYPLSFVIALNISSRIFLLGIGFWIASCFISALETDEIFFRLPWFLMRNPLSSNWCCTICTASFVLLLSWFFTWCLEVWLLSVQKFDYDVSCRLRVRSASGIYRIRHVYCQI